MTKHSAWIAAGVMVVMAFSFWFALAADESAGTARKPPPLKVDKTAPLLLEELPPGNELVDPEKPRADNSACFVCHSNFQDELIVTAHAKDDIGCIKCHGASVAHRNDEDNVTAPDKMFASVRIDKACRECHEDHNASARKVIKMFQTRFPAGTHPETVVCTDCHGEHRLKVRSVHWDKNTGKLLAHNPEAAKLSGMRKKKPADEKRLPSGFKPMSDGK
jgi:hypothetical protein